MKKTTGETEPTQKESKDSFLFFSRNRSYCVVQFYCTLVLSSRLNFLKLLIVHR